MRKIWKEKGQIFLTFRSRDSNPRFSVIFPPMIWIFMEGAGDDIKSKQASKRDRTLINSLCVRKRVFMGVWKVFLVHKFHYMNKRYVLYAHFKVPIGLCHSPHTKRTEVSYNLLWFKIIWFKIWCLFLFFSGLFCLLIYSKTLNSVTRNEPTHLTSD